MRVLPQQIAAPVKGMTYNELLKRYFSGGEGVFLHVIHLEDLFFPAIIGLAKSIQTKDLNSQGSWGWPILGLSMPTLYPPK